MCGITGYIGENPETTLLYKLTLLEYRGYDSAGIAVKGKAAANKRDTIAVTKRAGDLRVLKEAVQTSGATPDARFGIGHTRWATHGNQRASARFFRREMGRGAQRNHRKLSFFKKRTDCQRLRVLRRNGHGNDRQTAGILRSTGLFLSRSRKTDV